MLFRSPLIKNLLINITGLVSLLCLYSGIMNYDSQVLLYLRSSALDITVWYSISWVPEDEPSKTLAAAVAGFFLLRGPWRGKGLLIGRPAAAAARTYRI